VAQRFDNAEAMLRAWRVCFEGIEAVILSDHDEVDNAVSWMRWSYRLKSVGKGSLNWQQEEKRLGRAR